MTPEQSRAYESKALEALLERAVPSTSIPEEKILATVQRARIQGAQRRRILGTTTVLGFLLLVAATVWHWSGENSEELDFARALNVTRGLGDHGQSGVQAAAGKIYRDALSLLVLLHQHGAVTESLHREVLAALNDMQPGVIAYPHGLRGVRVTIQAGQPLSTSDEAVATAAVCAAVNALQELRQRDPTRKPLVDALLQSLRRNLEQPVR